MDMHVCTQCKRKLNKYNAAPQVNGAKHWRECQWVPKMTKPRVLYCAAWMCMMGAAGWWIGWCACAHACLAVQLYTIHNTIPYNTL